VVQQPDPWTVEFYTDARGKSPVEEFLSRLAKTDRAKIAHEIERLEIGGMKEPPPSARPLIGHKPLWELKPDKYRVIYFAYTGRRFILLQAFRKKSRRTPAKDIATAERRFAKFMERERR